MGPLSRDSRVAMHRQLSQRLRDSILRGDYKADGRLPTEPELMRRFKVSRITARQAVDALVREGLVVRQQGKGTFVADPVAHHDLLDLRGMYDSLVAQGLQPQTRLVDFRRQVPPAAVAARLGRRGRPFQHWRRLFELNGRPFALGVAHVETGRVRLSREAVERNPTYWVLEKLLGQKIARADVSIRYVPAPADLSRLLQVKLGAPLMMLERVSFGANGAPLEHSYYYAKAETYSFSLTVRGKLPITRSLTRTR